MCVSIYIYTCPIILQYFLPFGSPNKATAEVLVFGWGAAAEQVLKELPASQKLTHDGVALTIVGPTLGGLL